MDQGIVDFHTHAFPDDLAAGAMRTLMAEVPGIKAYCDGTTGDLIRSMDRAGIARCLVCCIATRPTQFDSIVRWCHQIRSPRLVPLPSIHPDDPDILDRVRQVRASGFAGLKMHPYYQDFHVADDRMFPFYEEVSRLGLLLVMHAGFDIAYPRVKQADPESMLRVVETFPNLRLVVAHLGGWRQWEDVRRHLLGRPIHMELSFAMQDLAAPAAREILMNHPEEYLLFGTDSPWTDQSETLSLLRKLELPASRLDRILSRNAAELLDRP